METGYKNECIILIGGFGFIGRHLRKLFLKEGYRLIIIGRSLQNTLQEGESFYSVKEYSFKEIRLLLPKMPVYAVIDLAYASVPGTSYADPVADFSENLTNVIRHLDFALAIEARRFIYISSGGTVYGDVPTAQPYLESDPNFPLSPYGVTKMACERYVHMYHRLYGLPTLIVRPSNIYGPGQKPFRGQGLVATALGLAFRKEPVHIFGTGSNVRDYLFIDDFCEGLVTLIRHQTSGEIYNLGYGAGYSILDLIDCVEATIRNDGLQLQRQYNAERPFDVRYNVLDTHKIQSETGWYPQTTLAAGVSKTWTWIKQYLQQNP